MNTNALAKRYNLLTPLERLPLIVAASVRGDELERDRLSHSAPRVLWKLSDYFPHAEALGSLALVHLADMLDQVAVFWKTLQVVETLSNTAAPDDQFIAKLEEAACMMAFTLVLTVDGWAVFCRGLNIDPDAPLRDLPGYKTWTKAVEEARDLAFTREEATKYAQSKIRGNDQYEVTEVTLHTPASVAADLRAAFDQRAGEWA